MIGDKEKYEKLIYETPLFNMDKDKQSVLYRKESLKLVEYLYCYLLAINKEKYEPYGCEIVDVATRCINGYDKSGDFIHYFNAAWSREYSHICGKEIINNKFQGMKLSGQERRDIKKYMRIVSRCNPNMTQEERLIKVSELMELPLERIKQISETADTRIVSEVAHNSEGEEVSLFDQVEEEFSTETYFDNLASLTELLDQVEAAYSKVQERQKPIISDMLTIKIGLDIWEIEKLAKKYEFISSEISENIKHTGNVPTQRDIAEKYGKNEASISRTMKEFLKKIREGARTWH